MFHLVATLPSASDGENLAGTFRTTRVVTSGGKALSIGLEFNHGWSGTSSSTREMPGNLSPDSSNVKDL